VQRLRIGCTTHIHKHNRGERPDTTLTITNSACNSLTAERTSISKTAEFQHFDFKS